jgi:hypothetical protein
LFSLQTDLPKDTAEAAKSLLCPFTAGLKRICGDAETHPRWDTEFFCVTGSNARKKVGENEKFPLERFLAYTGSLRDLQEY